MRTHLILTWSVLALTLTAAGAHTGGSAATTNSDAALAAKDGSAAGRWFLRMVGDGDFSKQEQEQIRAILPGYYGLRIYWHRPRGLSSYRGDYAYTTMDGLSELAAYFRQKDSLKPERIEFWANPTPEVRRAAEKRASEAIKRISRKILGLKSQYPELDRFDLKNIDLSDIGFWYAPNEPERYTKRAEPVVGVAIGPPCLVMTQAAFRTRVILPKQKLEIERTVMTGNRPLDNKITSIIQTESLPLLAAERLLRGEPIFEFWYRSTELSDVGKP